MTSDLCVPRGVTIALHSPPFFPMVSWIASVTLFCLLSLSVLILADEQKPFDCHVVVSGAEFDLTKLAHEYNLNRTREMPPTTMIDQLRFNLCADLKHVEGVEDRDQVSILNHLKTTPVVHVTSSAAKALVLVLQR